MRNELSEFRVLAVGNWRGITATVTAYSQNRLLSSGRMKIGQTNPSSPRAVRGYRDISTSPHKFHHFGHEYVALQSPQSCASLP